MWEFYQDEGMAAIGQFDLKIYFRIPKMFPWPASGIIKDKYCIDWNLEVNHKRLVDHDIDFWGKWNMIVNERRLMDRYEGNDDGKKPEEDGSIHYWNVPMQHLSSDEQDKMKEKVKASMN